MYSGALHIAEILSLLVNTCCGSQIQKLCFVVALQTLQTLQEVLSRSVNPNSTESQNGFASPTLQDTSVDDSATDSQSERPEQIELR